MGILSQHKSVKSAGDNFISRYAIDNIKNTGSDSLYFTDNL